MLSKILVANRGEIAVRVMRTAKKEGYQTVAVYSDADKHALHVKCADQAVYIGESAVHASYLNIDAIIAAAKKVNADAIHPGYGFLSENENFASACDEAGIIFIGPPSEAIELMGNKARAKSIMQEAGVPCVPGFLGENQSLDTFKEEAKIIGFPLLVKAAAGGGGRGMRLVESADALEQGLVSAKSEAKSAFGSDEIILEKAITNAHHVEIQVFADKHGNIVHLGERDCSLQRRHQKVIEEAPSPIVTADIRQKMGESAVAAARAVNYCGAGTVEFLLTEKGEYYFLEMNTRLQVEHPVTEYVTGLDLVAWQLMVADGQPLPLKQNEISITGHAMEARLYAEDPENNFLPQTGKVFVWKAQKDDYVRCDSGIRESQEISAFYDPMVAKIVTFGDTRDQARRRLDSALKNSAFVGPQTNKNFLSQLLNTESFIAGKAHTQYIDENLDEITERPSEESDTLLSLAGMLFTSGAKPEGQLWRSSGTATHHLCVNEARTGLIDLKVESVADNQFRVETSKNEGKSTIVECVEQGPGWIRFCCDGVMALAHFAFDKNDLYVSLCNYQACYQRQIAYGKNTQEEDLNQLASPIEGTVVKIDVNAGDQVNKGQALVVVEAMKMEHLIAAKSDARVLAISVQEGQQVSPRQCVVQLEPIE